MKTATLVFLICTATLAGCATRAPESITSTRNALTVAFDKRVIDCALPFMSTHGISSAEVRYRYSNGSAQFHTRDAALTAHLAACAAPVTGPRAEFDGNIEIWPANAS